MICTDHAQSSLGYAIPLMPFVASGPAFSEEGQFIAASWSRTVGKLRESYMIGHAALREDLLRLGAECSSRDWDGYGAQPLNEVSVANAYVLLDSIPQPPVAISLTIGADPDGQVSLEWRKAKGWAVSVSVSPDGDLHYAAVLGSSMVQGTERFNPLIGLPQAIGMLIQRLERA